MRAFLLVGPVKSQGSVGYCAILRVEGFAQEAASLATVTEPH